MVTINPEKKLVVVYIFYGILNAVIHSIFWFAKLQRKLNI